MSAFSKNKDKNIDFYTNVLGLRLVLNTVHQERPHIRHLFFGDELATPGTLLTFFVYPKMGRRYPRDSYFSTIVLKIPEGTLSYWKNRLKNKNIDILKETNHSLIIQDPDTLDIELKEFPKVIDEDKAVSDTDVPREYQIIEMADQKMVVEDIDTELQFVNDWLDLKAETPSTNDTNSFKLTMSESNETEHSRMGRGTIDHVALGVDHKEDLVKLRDKAKDLGFKIDMFKDRGYFASLYIRSPHNLRFEIATNERIPTNRDTTQLTIPDPMKEHLDTIKETFKGEL